MQIMRALDNRNYPSVDYLGAGALAQYFGAAGVVFGGGIAAFAGAIFFAYKLSLMPKKSFGGV